MEGGNGAARIRDSYYHGQVVLDYEIMRLSWSVSMRIYDMLSMLYEECS